VTVKYREGTRTFGVKPEVALAALKKIEAAEARHGRALTPEAVVDAASDPKHPLHTAFPWDDQTAAHEFRLIRARTLIRSVTITTTDKDQIERAVYVHVRDVGYKTMEAVISRDDYFATALGELETKLEGAQRALLELRRFAEEQGEEPDRLAAIALASQGFSAVKEALAILR
jgi:hypothetical protein